jgi:hypothetical protein
MRTERALAPSPWPLRVEGRAPTSEAGGSVGLRACLAELNKHWILSWDARCVVPAELECFAGVLGRLAFMPSRDVLRRSQVSAGAMALALIRSLGAWAAWCHSRFLARAAWDLFRE